MEHIIGYTHEENGNMMLCILVVHFCMQGCCHVAALCALRLVAGKFEVDLSVLLAASRWQVDCYTWHGLQSMIR